MKPVNYQANPIARRIIFDVNRAISGGSRCLQSAASGHPRDLYIACEFLGRAKALSATLTREYGFRNLNEPVARLAVSVNSAIDAKQETKGE